MSEPGGAGAAAARAAPRYLARPAERVSFFREQRRRRRQSWIFFFACLLIAGAMGVILSAVLSPLLLLAAGGLLRLAAMFGIDGGTAAAASRAIGRWAGAEVDLIGAILDQLDRAKTRADYAAMLAQLPSLFPAFVPGLVASALAWLWMKRLLTGAGMADLVAALHPRPPRAGDLEERQLANVVEEMAIAAGLPVPRFLLVDTPIANAALIGRSHRDATLLVTRGLLDRLNRAETEGVIGHLVGAMGNGDLRVIQSLVALFRTLAMFHTMLDLTFRMSAWPAFASFLAAALRPRSSPAALERAAIGLEDALSLEVSFRKAAEPFNKLLETRPGQGLRRFGKPLLVLFFPFMLILFVIGMQKFLLQIWILFFLGWPVAATWRARRFLADSTAVQLTRDPAALAAALERLAKHGGVPPGGEERSYLFLYANRDGRERFAERQGMTARLHPSLGARIERLHAQGAGGAARPSWRPKTPIVFALLALGLLIIAPLLLVLAVLVAGLTVFGIEIGLVGGLTLVRAVLGG
jgi:Zn-dependent protease with chaperone function